jgi:uncharacterized membrane protein
LKAISPYHIVGNSRLLVAILFVAIGFFLLVAIGGYYINGY